MKTVFALIVIIFAIALCGCDRSGATAAPVPIAKPKDSTVLDQNPNIPDAERNSLKGITGLPKSSPNGN